MKQKVL